MPYIDGQARHQIEHGRPAMTAGELNYVITKAVIAGGRLSVISSLMYRYWSGAWQVQNYQTINDILGAAFSACIEVQRRGILPAKRRGQIIEDIGAAIEEFYNTMAVPYEDKKIVSNGDVYT